MTFESYSICIELILAIYSTCLMRSLKKKTKIGFQDQLSLNACQKFAFCNTFDLPLSYHLYLRHLFCLFLSCRLRQLLSVAGPPWLNLRFYLALTICECEPFFCLFYHSVLI